MECCDVSESIWQREDTEYEHRPPDCCVDIHDILPSDDFVGIPRLVSVTRHCAILVLVSSLFERFEDQHRDTKLESWRPDDRMQVFLAVRIVVISITSTTSTVLNVWIAIRWFWMRINIVLTGNSCSWIFLMNNFVFWFRCKSFDSLILLLIRLS